MPARCLLRRPLQEEFHDLIRRIAPGPVTLDLAGHRHRRSSRRRDDHVLHGPSSRCRRIFLGPSSRIPASLHRAWRRGGRRWPGSTDRRCNAYRQEQFRGARRHTDFSTWRTTHPVSSGVPTVTVARPHDVHRKADRRQRSVRERRRPVSPGTGARSLLIRLSNTSRLLNPGDRLGLPVTLECHRHEKRRPGSQPELAAAGPVTAGVRTRSIAARSRRAGFDLAVSGAEAAVWRCPDRTDTAVDPASSRCAVTLPPTTTRP